MAIIGPQRESCNKKKNGLFPTILGVKEPIPRQKPFRTKSATSIIVARVGYRVTRFEWLKIGT